MTRDLNALLDHPNVRRYLDLIAQAEGTAGHADAYRVGFGGAALADLSRHPGTRHAFKQTDGKTNATTAAGRYQFLHSTWKDLAGALGLTDFSPRSQDLGALELMRRSGSLDDVLRGDFTSAVRKDGRTWASLPSSPYPQPKRSDAFVAQALASPAAPPPMPYGPAASSAVPALPSYRPLLPPMLPAPTGDPPHAVRPPPPFMPTAVTVPSLLAPLPEAPYSLEQDLQQLRRPPITP